MKMNPPQKINRINYIVQENPEGVVALLHSEGIQVPQDLAGLILRTKEWVSKEGKPAILKLLQEHPEKELLQNLNGESQFQNFSGCGCKSSFTGGGCGCKSSYNGKEVKCKRCDENAKKLTQDELLEGLKEMRDDELLPHYEQIKQASNEQPDNQRLKEEVEFVWEYLQHRQEGFSPKTSAPKEKKTKEKEKAPSALIHKTQKAVFSITSKELAIGGFMLGMTILVIQLKS